MAVRIHVTASLADYEAIRNAFRNVFGETFDNIQVESTPPWNFFTTSVWGVDGSKLVEGLQASAAVGIQVTTADASRWHLTLIRPGHPPQTFLHDFYLFRGEFDPNQTVDPPEEDEIDPRLTFLQPDPNPGTDRPWSQFDQVADDYASMGSPIDLEFRDIVQELNHGAAVNQFRQYESHRLADALANAGLQFDRQTLIDALLWGSTTPQEQDADIGNLPSVLLALGLKGSIADFFTRSNEAETYGSNDDETDEYQDDCDNEDERDDEQEIDDEEICEEDRLEIQAAEEQIRQMQRQASRSRSNRKAKQASDPQEGLWGQDTFLSATRNAAAVHSLTPIDGGSVTLRMDEIPLLDFFAHAVQAENFPTAVVTIVPPPSIKAVDIEVSNPNCTDIEVRPGKGEWYVGARSLDVIEGGQFGDSEGEDFLISYLGRGLTELVRQPPDGTRLRVDYADPTQPEICLRFSGTIVDGQWEIGDVYPRMAQQTLKDAMNWARQQELDEYELYDENEAEEIARAAEKDGYLHNMGVTRERNRIRCQHDGMGFVARLILRRRFGHVWNFGPALQHIELKWQERKSLEQKMRRQAASMRRDRSPPLDRTQVIYRGESSVYWSADMVAWSVLEAEPRKNFDTAMDSLGYLYLGDFVCKRVRDYVQRCFISPDYKTYGLIIAGSFGYVGQEFVSHFQNDSHLTTSTSWLAQSHPEVEVYAQHCPELNIEGLYQRHQWGIERFRSCKQTEPVPFEPTLARLCQLFDQMLGRMSQVESQLISFESINIQG